MIRFQRPKAPPYVSSLGQAAADLIVRPLIRPRKENLHATAQDLTFARKNEYVSTDCAGAAPKDDTKVSSKHAQ